MGYGIRGGYEGGPQAGFGRGGPNGQRRPARDQEPAGFDQKRRRF
jgi:hypothetical protein